MKLQSRKILFQKKIDSLQGDIIEKQNLIATKRAQINGVENLRSSFIERREVVETEIKTFNEGVSNTKQEIENCKKEISEKSEKCGKMKETINRHNENINKLKSENDKLTSSLNNMNVEYNSKYFKEENYLRYGNDYAGYSRA